LLRGFFSIQENAINLEPVFESHASEIQAKYCKAEEENSGDEFDEDVANVETPLADQEIVLPSADHCSTSNADPLQPLPPLLVASAERSV